MSSGAVTTERRDGVLIVHLDDVVALAGIPNLGGVITGKAVYEGRFTVSEALDALAAARA